MGLDAKSGTSMSSIVDTNTVASVPCNCRKCYHSEKRNGILYCKQYDLVRPHKRKCKRYTLQDYHVTLDEYNEVKQKKENRKEPIFPWERL